MTRRQATPRQPAPPAPPIDLWHVQHAAASLSDHLHINGVKLAQGDGEALVKLLFRLVQVNEQVVELLAGLVQVDVPPLPRPAGEFDESYQPAFCDWCGGELSPLGHCSRCDQ